MEGKAENSIWELCLFEIFTIKMAVSKQEYTHASLKF